MISGGTTNGTETRRPSAWRSCASAAPGRSRWARALQRGRKRFTRLPGRPPDCASPRLRSCADGVGLCHTVGWGPSDQERIDGEGSADSGSGPRNAGPGADAAFPESRNHRGQYGGATGVPHEIVRSLPRSRRGRSDGRDEAPLLGVGQAAGRRRDTNQIVVTLRRTPVSAEEVTCVASGSSSLSCRHRRNRDGTPCQRTNIDETEANVVERMLRIKARNNHFFLIS